jgi:CheY-like chemotaxis protein
MESTSWTEARWSPPAAGRPARVLVGLANDEARRAVGAELEAEGYAVEQAHTGYEVRVKLAWGANEGEPYDLVLVDLELRGPSLLETLPNAPWPTRVIVVAREVTERVHSDARRVGAVVVDEWFAAADLRDCAVELVAPVQICAPVRVAHHDEFCTALWHHRWLRRSSALPLATALIG